MELMIYPEGESLSVYHRPTGPGVDYADIVVAMNEEKGLLEITSQEEVAFQLKVVTFQKPVAVSGADHFEYDPANSELLLQNKGRSVQITIEGLAGYGSR